LFGTNGGGSHGFSGFLALSLKGLALDVPHFLFKGAFEVGGSLAEFGHEFAEAAGEFGELVRPEDDQDDDKQNDHVGHAEHRNGWPQEGLLAS
jgi:hypothetical protein